MIYLSMDGGQQEAKQCAAVDRINPKEYFNPQKITIILSMLYLKYFHGFILPFLVGNYSYLNQISLSPHAPDSIYKISHFTTQNTGVAALLLFQSVSLCSCATYDL